MSRRKSMVPLILFHAHCQDGFAAAWAAWKLHRDDADYLAVSYQEPPPDVTGRDVVLLDFSYKRLVLEGMAEIANSISILDHHKSAEEDLAAYRVPIDALREGIGSADGKAPIKAVFDMNHSGARLAWDFFHPPSEIRPALINYVEDRDLWRFKMKLTREFCAGLASHPMDFKVWDGLSTSSKAGPVIRAGTAILRYQRQRVEEVKAKAYPAHIGGYTVPVVNAPAFMASDLGNELSQGHPFAATYYEDDDTIFWSLRSRAPDGVDVSEIAKRHGGGGHKHAAGFSLPRAVDGGWPT